MRLLLLISILFIIVSCGKECEFSMRLIPGFNPFVQRDSNGKECRAKIELPFCRGFCKTSESGTHGFPPRVQNSSACTLVKTSIRTIRLDDCDVGASESIRFVKIPHGDACECTVLPVDQTNFP
ncbi:unnamed protein product [Caenorhabditis bovis]|uniref:Glycoprotein hormone subunit beta domain-containing protein n=1 Tax=Caenorhabditis bovis TaxID=2654633 RepID=A0A8S1EGR1_9PELO|nr:unnamed protein product [Caenorhabditis bovis]